MEETKKPKVLLFDLEITPTLGWTYGRFDTNVLYVEKEPYILCFAYCWEGEPIKCVSLTDFKRYKKHPEDDYEVVKKLWELLDEADVVIAHNASRFDNKVANERFLYHKLGPVSPFRTIDTLSEVRKNFKNGSNSLDNLCQKFGLGRKPDETHGALWHACIEKDHKAWWKMIQYCKNDVLLLYKLYELIKPYIHVLPNVALMTGKIDTCPRCGASSKHLQYRGYKYTQTAKYHRVRCTKCGGWSQERLMDKDTRKYDTPIYKSI